MLCLLAIAGKGKSQVYPVQAFVQLSPPYSGYLPDYADPFNEQMKIILTLNDFSVPSYTVKIRLSITGSGFSIQTKPYLALPPIELSPGVPFQLSGSELAFYLSSSNLDFTGISVSDYETRKVLPEGMYAICIEVLDYYSATDLVVANKACAQAWFTLQLPPVLNTPFCGSTVNPLSPQVVLFSWSPLSMSWAGAISNTEYELSLYELRPTGTNANVVINTTPPIFTTVTNQTFYNYGITDPPLQEGMSYVWRVKAVDITGRDAFANNGFSEVCTFTYGNIGESIAGTVNLTLNASGTGTRQGIANWNASSVFTHYTLEVRKKGSSAYTWFPYTSLTGIFKINSLEPQTQYECRVKGHSGSFESNYSNVAEFTTLVPSAYACNSTAFPPTETIIHPLLNLVAGNVVDVGQFEMLVTYATTSSPGYYSGFGKVEVPFMLINLNVSFDYIFIDDNMNVRSGKIKALTQDIEQWAAAGLDNSYNFVDPDYYVNADVDSIVVDGNHITIFTDEGPIVIDYPGGNYVVEDENGDQWIIYEDGTIVYTPALPHIELTLDERKIYALALKQIREEYHIGIFNQRKQDYQQKSAALENKMENLVGVNYFHPVASTDKGILIVEEVGEQGVQSGFTEVNEFNEANANYLLVTGLKSIAKYNLSQPDYDFLANKVLINNQPSYLYIRQQLTSLQPEVLAGIIKENIVEMVKKEIR